MEHSLSVLIGFPASISNIVSVGHSDCASIRQTLFRLQTWICLTNDAEGFIGKVGT